MSSDYQALVKWNENGLVPVIAQDAVSGRVLMMAWMNAEALAATVASGKAVYWSRSRNKLWHKGESSGNEQLLHSLHIDCDGDTLLLKVQQKGGVACHTGRESCFYRRLNTGAWELTDPVLKDPSSMYSNN